MINILTRCLAGMLALIVVLVAVAWFVLLRPVAQANTNDPLQVFNHGSIGAETAQGLPYWIWRVLPTMFSILAGQPGRFRLDRRLLIPGEELPVGFSAKTLGVIPRVTPNCAFCHQGSYRLHPDDPATFVPGGCRHAGQRPRLHTLPGRGRPRQGSVHRRQGHDGDHRNLRHAAVGAHALPLSADSGGPIGIR
jgi:hypothetical protein